MRKFLLLASYVRKDHHVPQSIVGSSVLIRLSRQCRSNEVWAKVKTLGHPRKPYHRYVLYPVDVADLSSIPRCTLTSSSDLDFAL